MAAVCQNAWTWIFFHNNLQFLKCYTWSNCPVGLFGNKHWEYRLRTSCFGNVHALALSVCGGAMWSAVRVWVAWQHWAELHRSFSFCQLQLSNADLASSVGLLPTTSCLGPRLLLPGKDCYGLHLAHHCYSLHDGNDGNGPWLLLCRNATETIPRSTTGLSLLHFSHLQSASHHNWNLISVPDKNVHFLQLLWNWHSLFR